MESKNINLCLILDDTNISDVNRRELKHILEGTDSYINHVLVDETTAHTKKENKTSNENTERSGINWRHFKKFFEVIRSEGAPALLQAERHLARTLDQEYMDWLSEEFDTISEQHNIYSFPEIDESKVKYFKPLETEGAFYEFPENIVERVSEDCDVALLLGFNRLISGEILDAPEWGILSYHWSDIRKYRGRPGCLWQYLNNESKIGFSIQRLTENIDGGSLIHCEHTNIESARTWQEVRLRATKIKGTGLFTESIRKLKDPEFSSENLDEEDLGILTHSSDKERWTVILRVIAKNINNRYIKDTGSWRR